MLTDTYYKNLFTKPLTLNEKQSNDFIQAIKTSYRQERRKRTDEVVQNILLKLGRYSISRKDNDLIRICYHVAPHSFHGKPTEKTIREMWRCISSGLRNSKLFRKQIIDRKTIYFLNTNAFPCKERRNGHCSINHNYCELCDPIECGYFIIKTQKNKKISPSELVDTIKISHIAANSDWMDNLLKQYKQ